MNTGKFVAAGKAGELKDGEKKKVGIGGQEVMLAKVAGKYYAIANKCPHMGGDLSMGILTGTMIQCPRHGSQFDVTDGHNIRWMKGEGLAAALGKIVKSPRPVRTYKVKVEGDDILVEI